MSTRLAYGARLVGGSLFDWWIGLSRTPDKISAETFALARKFRGRECGQHDELARPDVAHGQKLVAADQTLDGTGLSFAHVDGSYTRMASCASIAPRGVPGVLTRRAQRQD